MADARPCCSVGARADAPAIDEALRHGEGLGAVAKRHPGVVRGTLGKHRQRCLGIRSGEAPETGGDTPGATPETPPLAEAAPRPGRHSRAREKSQQKSAETRATATPPETGGDTSETPPADDHGFPPKPPTRELDNTGCVLP
jgi:hypothetical protein